MRIPQDPTSSIRWLAVYNAGATPVPPYGVMKSNGLNSEKEYIVTQPDGDSLTEVLINGPVSIPALTSSEGHRTEPGKVLIESADGPPFGGDDWGTQAGTWKLRKGKTGFRVIGAGNDANTAEMTFMGPAFKELSAGGGATAFSGCRLLMTGAQTVPNSTLTTLINWDSEDYDTDTYHDNTTNNTRITIPTTGYYRVSYYISMQLVGFTPPAAGGFVLSHVRLNGSGLLIGFEVLTEDFLQYCPAFSYHNKLSADVHLTAGDYLEVRVNTGSMTHDVSVNYAGTGYSHFGVSRLG